MRTSRFVSLSQYCVAEYMFDQLGSLDFYTDDFILLENTTADIHQIFNDDGSYSSTKNIKDLTATPIGNNTFVYLDSEKIPDYLSYDANITQTTLSGYTVVMDKVRFHFVAGFDFDDFRALILSVKHTENDGKSNLFANLLLAPETIGSLIAFNPKPLFLGNALYDRYIDILVPSIKNINEDYKTAPNPALTFAAAITPNAIGSTGFIYNNPISIGLAECGVKKTLFTNIGQSYDAYEVTEFYEAALSQSNEFDNVGAFINEAANGDFIEFYLTFNGGFPSDLLAILNARNPSDDWIIIHQISVFEQVGTAFINTSRFVFFQEDRYDEPNVFRPVLRNANEAVSMSIDYLVRLTNRRNGEQIIREGSFSLVSPKKYGRQLINLPLLDKPQSQVIYNKIIKNNFEASSLFVEPSLSGPVNPGTEANATVVTQTEYVPIFFNNNNISVSNTSATVSVTDSVEEVVFGPGKLRFIISPFDNIIKLKVYTTNASSRSKTPIPLDLNINSAKYRLVFETTSGKISIDNANNAQLENLSTGVLAFNVSKKDSETIIQSNIKTVYLVAVSQDGKETLIYTGEWRKPTEQADVDAAIAAARAEASQQAQVQSILRNIESLISGKEIQRAALDVNTLSAIQNIAITPVVNKFGLGKNTAASVMPTSKSTSAGRTGNQDSTTTSGGRTGNQGSTASSSGRSGS